VSTDHTPAARASPAAAPDQRPGPRHGKLRFRDVEVDLDTGELWRGGAPLRLRPLAARALQLLAQNRHRTVSREELRHHLWGDAALEWETGLHQLIRQLRRALDDDPQARRFIATIPRRGYRWTAPELPAIDAGARKPRWKEAGLFLAGAATLVLAVLLLCLLVGLVS
jgi:DNA-binding winged helix-turn-helix (wHTH) protein